MNKISCFSWELSDFFKEKIKYKATLLRNFKTLHEKLEKSTFSENSKEYIIYQSIRDALLRHFQINGIALDDLNIIKEYKDLNLREIYNF